jgi:hypothetical protein
MAQLGREVARCPRPPIDDIGERAVRGDQHDTVVVDDVVGPGRDSVDPHASVEVIDGSRCAGQDQPLRFARTVLARICGDVGRSVVLGVDRHLEDAIRPGADLLRDHRKLSRRERTRIPAPEIDECYCDGIAAKFRERDAPSGLIHEERLGHRVAGLDERHDAIGRRIGACPRGAQHRREGESGAGSESWHMADGFVSGPLSPADRRRLLAMRRWRPEELRVVRRGLLGRLSIAIEPAVIAIVFACIAYWLAAHGRRDATHDDWIFSIVFVPGAAAFAAYAVLLLVEPVRALRQTAQPIFVVEGYVRTRGRDDFSESGSNGFVAVLTHDKRVAGEWPTRGSGDLAFCVSPAQIEFSEYGGIHSIDGAPTGVLPEDFPPLGVGAAARGRAKRDSTSS